MSDRPRPRRTIVLRGAVFEDWGGSSRIRLTRDNAAVVAAPQDDPAYLATAARLGWGDGSAAAAQMSRWHDMTHAWVAQLLGADESAVLRAIATDTLADLPDWLVAGEEALVLAFTRWCLTGEGAPELAPLAMAGVDLDETRRHALALWGREMP